MAVVFKRKALTIAEKMEILEKYDNNNKLIKRKILVKQLGIPDSTFRSIIKSREQIKKNALSGAINRQKVRARKYDELEKSLLQWYNQAWALKIPVNGPVLQIKAQEIATMLGLEFFRSNGWLDRFRQRHDIFYKQISREPELVDAPRIASLDTSIIAKLINQYTLMMSSMQDK